MAPKKILTLIAYSLFVVNATAMPVCKEVGQNAAMLLSTPRNDDHISRGVAKEVRSVQRAAGEGQIEAVRSTPRRFPAEDAAPWGGDYIRSTPRHVDVMEDEGSTP
ncbi:hypothetical protein VKT23_013776 [Stygiomarasmius scandens]|uniref:Uncharacterized protein n=1 Tax=Marasmiellus scandens TaxID=2682957 RepID=A0ABR1J534_9AGAR